MMDDEDDEDDANHLVCEFVMLMASSSPGEGGAGEEPLSHDFVLVTWEERTRCHLRWISDIFYENSDI